MTWSVSFDATFLEEATSFPLDVREGLVTMIDLLERFGPELKRPHCDTLKASRHKNIKELRFSAADGVWRVAFAFDPKRQAILLVAGDKSGMSVKRFYKALLSRADDRFDRHLATLKV